MNYTNKIVLIDLYPILWHLDILPEENVSAFVASLIFRHEFSSINTEAFVCIGFCDESTWNIREDDGITPH